MAIVARCLEAAFVLTGEEEAGIIEGVKVFKYIGRLLDWSEDEWPAVLHNIWKARQVWGRLGRGRSQPSQKKIIVR